MPSNIDAERPDNSTVPLETRKLFGKDYLKWKRWGKDSSFAKLTKVEAAYFRAELRRAKHRFPEKSSVLEVGFGNGAFLSFSQERRWDIYGIEINEALVNVALDRGFSVALAGDLGGFKDDSFDLIVAFDVLEHIHQDALSEFFKDIKRVLRPGGFFLARFPNGDSPFGLINQNGDVTHITAIGSGKAHYYAAKYDLKIVFIGGEAQPLTGLKFTSLVRLSLTLPLRKLINWCVCMVFFGRSNIAFTSTNLTVIFKKLLS